MSDDSLATHHPPFDVHNPVFQSHRDRIERERFADLATIDAFSRIVTETYRAAGRSRLIQIAMFEMLKFYGTQQSVADILGIDRSCVSVAKDHGELGSGPLADMLSNCRVLQWLTDHSDHILRDMGRRSFIAAARHAYTLWDGLDDGRVELGVARYEELCRTLPAGLSDIDTDPQWRDVFVYVFATLEGTGDPDMW